MLSTVGLEAAFSLVRTPLLELLAPFATQFRSARSYSALASSSGTRQTIPLPDRRHLSFEISGAENGYPIFYLHGHPGSRLEAAIINEDAAELGATLIAIDRPGVGHSTPQPGRMASQHADDVKYLAAELGLNEYKVLAVSGGGPYGLACARFCSRKLKTVAMLAGMVWLPGVGYRGMHVYNQLLYSLAKTFPGILRWLVSYLSAKQLNVTDEKLVELSQKKLERASKTMPDIDRELMADGSLVRLTMPSYREHFRQGVDGFMDEFRVLNNPVDFDLGEIVAPPILLWYGKQDVNVPPIVGEELSKRLGMASKLTVLDETHLSLLMKRKRQILQDLLDQQ